MAATKKKMSLATKILIAMVLGAIAGFVIGEPATKIEFVGTIWLNIIKMIMVPTVVCMIVKGISSMDNPKKLGRISLEIVIFYVVTTVIATLIGMLVAEVFQPGIGFQFSEGTDPGEVSEISSFGNFMVSLFSSNMFSSFANANMMQILIIAVLLGLAIVLIPNKETRVT